MDTEKLKISTLVEQNTTKKEKVETTFNDAFVVRIKCVTTKEHNDEIGVKHGDVTKTYLVDTKKAKTDFKTKNGLDMDNVLKLCKEKTKDNVVLFLITQRLGNVLKSETRNAIIQKVLLPPIAIKA